MSRPRLAGAVVGLLGGGRIALEERVLALGVEGGGRFVQDEHERLIAHEAAGEGQLLPLAERNLDAVGPRRAELRFQPGCQAGETTSLGPGATDGRLHGRLVVEPRHIAQTDRLAGLEFEAEKVLKRAGQPRAPFRRPACGTVRRRRSGCGPLVGS